MSFQDNPNLVSKKAAPNADTSIEFPMDEVVSRLDLEAKFGSTMSKDQVLLIMHELFVWITSAKAHDQRAIKSIGIRAIAAAWVMNPNLFDNSAAHMVARSYSVSHQKLNSRTADFSRRFGIKNRFQAAHDWQN